MLQQLKIVSIKKIEPDHVYDIEMPQIHNFILGNGIVSHNSHSAAYAKIAYETQWLKVHYPLEFWTTAIQFSAEEDVPALINEMNKLKQGISIKPPSVNESEIDFRCNPKTKSIYWSLAKIKGLGAKTVEHIISTRGKKPFADYDDFIARVPKAKVNRGHIEKMILAGCFDECCDIEQPHERLGILRKHAQEKGYELKANYSNPESRKNYVWVIWQKELTGYGDIDFRALISQQPKLKKHSKLFAPPEVFFAKKDYEEILVVGIVSDLFERRTKKGDIFIIMTLLYNNEAIKVLIWADIVEANVQFLEKCEKKVIALNGKVRFDSYSQTNSVHCTDETEFYFL